MLPQSLSTLKRGIQILLTLPTAKMVSDKIARAQISIVSYFKK